MNPILKTILITTSPALLAAAPATQPSTQPATQPAPTQTAQTQSPDPLVIPDGTSIQNPGPQFRVRQGQWGSDIQVTDGIRF